VFSAKSAEGLENIPVRDLDIPREFIRVSKQWK
jgi:hypothetical protein